MKQAREKSGCVLKLLHTVKERAINFSSKHELAIVSEHTILSSEIKFTTKNIVVNSTKNSSENVLFLFKAEHYTTQFKRTCYF